MSAKILYFNINKQDRLKPKYNVEVCTYKKKYEMK